MSYPAFCDPAFPNTVQVRLCDDSGNAEGGYNPVPGSPYSFPASVQDKGGNFQARGGEGVTISVVNVYFQTNPDLTLSRPIGAGDTITTDTGMVCSVLRRVEDRGGFGFLWLVRCEHVATR